MNGKDGINVTGVKLNFQRLEEEDESSRELPLSNGEMQAKIRIKCTKRRLKIEKMQGGINRGWLGIRCACEGEWKVVALGYHSNDKFSRSLFN